MNNTTTTVSLPDDALKRLRERSEKEDRSVSSLVRIAVKEFLGKLAESQVLR